MIPDWCGLIERGEAAELAALASDRLGVEVPPLALLRLCRAIAASARRDSRSRLGDCGGGASWSDATWRSFLKLRALELGCLGGHGEVEDGPVVTCRFHVGFPCLEENEEHLARLRSNPQPGAVPAPARSRIGSTAAILVPIDATAARVLPCEANGPAIGDGAPSRRPAS